RRRPHARRSSRLRFLVGVLPLDVPFEPLGCRSLGVAARTDVRATRIPSWDILCASTCPDCECPDWQPPPRHRRETVAFMLDTKVLRRAFREPVMEAGRLQHGLHLAGLVPFAVGEQRLEK